MHIQTVDKILIKRRGRQIERFGLEVNFRNSSSKDNQFAEAKLSELVQPFRGKV